jgi:hypothetical protein
MYPKGWACSKGGAKQPIMIYSYIPIANIFFGISCYLTENTVCLNYKDNNGEIPYMYLGIHIKYTLFLSDFNQKLECKDKFS